MFEQFMQDRNLVLKNLNDDDYFDLANMGWNTYAEINSIEQVLTLTSLSSLTVKNKKSICEDLEYNASDLEKEGILITSMESNSIPEKLVERIEEHFDIEARRHN
jgi:hypothetical protein